MDYRLYIFDALSGKLRVSNEHFMTMGAAQSSTFRVEMKVRTGGTFVMQGDVCRFFPHGQVKDYSINGMHPGRDVRIHPSTMYLITIAGGCVLCWFGGEEDLPPFHDYDISKWYSYDIKSRAWSDSFTLPELSKMGDTIDPDALVSFDGMVHSAFLAKDLMEVSECAAILHKQQRKDEDSNKAKQVDPAKRELICPYCWNSFKAGDILSIASQPSLKGDRLLGPDAMQRFKPTQFNAQGLPLDEEGALCRGMACPHCHYKLPPFYSELTVHPISMLGIQGSGKTYYLTTLINEAVRTISRDFDASFRDVAPAANSPLNRLRQQIFTAESPQQAYLEPTRIQPPFYQHVWKDDHFSFLPAPYLYGLSRQGNSCTVLTYDNAGSDFEPGNSEESERVTGHLDIASAIFFLFDPTGSPSFMRVRHTEDATAPSTTSFGARQSAILSELEMQLRMRFNQPPPAKLPIPLAFIMTKSDAWLHLLGPEPLLPVVHNGRLMPSCIQTNSKRLRRLLFSVCPQLCVSAEALFENVCYFAVSALGKAPVEFIDPATGEARYAPESGDIHPSHVIDPLLWTLNMLEPKLLPKNH